ncbi:MAG: TonB-dependent receptor [Chitinophagaceae bacterium]
MKKIVCLSALILLGSLFTTSFAQKLPRVTLKLTVLDTDSTPMESFSGTLSYAADLYLIRFNSEMVEAPRSRYALTINAPFCKPYITGINLYNDTEIVVKPERIISQVGSSVIITVIAKDKSSFALSNVKAAELKKNNLGQDFTYLIGNTPSAVTTSDAGAGVGYTGIRIRGSDATRISVTVNGIPINDAESHGVYWVNMPDLASSTSQVQIQRGVGTSTIGTGAFGANINIVNNELKDQPYLNMQQSYGSFNTSKSTLMFGTGKLNNFNFEGRLSKIVSDGYIDRASSDLQSYQLALSYNKNDFDLNAISFGGKEKTYQSWYGTPESRVNNDDSGMRAYADRNYLTEAQKQNLLNSGRTYNYYTYPNQTDNYWQNHYQLHMRKVLNKSISLRTAFFATTGKGYYEEFKEGASFANYRVSDFYNGTDTITSTDLVRQRWLDNILYGNYSSFSYSKRYFDINAGLSYSAYHGKHFGKVIWADIAQPFGKDRHYYESKSNKQELNAYVKAHYILKRKTQLNLELQNRYLTYGSSGIDNDGTKIDFDVDFYFFNPKFGISHTLKKYNTIYSSYSIGNREPVRTDFIDNPAISVPQAENLKDLELGYIYRKNNQMFQVNFYNMQYKNQLVVTGELNDVGNAIRRNVKNSYRRGVELMLLYPILDKLVVDANMTISSNKIKGFEDVYFNYDAGQYNRDVYASSNIAFSPDLIAYAGVTDKHIKYTEIGINLKYVGKQYLDNTSNEGRKLPAYTTLNMLINRQFKFRNGSSIVIKGAANNLLGIFYSNNGYTYKYVYSGTLTQENFYYPQSGKNFVLGLEFQIL